MLNLDMAGVIAAMRGTPKPRHLRSSWRNPFDVRSKPTEMTVLDPAEAQAWAEHQKLLAVLNEWRDDH